MVDEINLPPILVRLNKPLVACVPCLDYWEDDTAVDSVVMGVILHLLPKTKVLTVGKRKLNHHPM